VTTHSYLRNHYSTHEVSSVFLLHRLSPGNATNAIDSSVSVFQGSCPRWLASILRHFGVATQQFQQCELHLPRLRQGATACPRTRMLLACRPSRPVRFLLAFCSTLIPSFSHLVIHDQDFCSLLDIYVFRNGASSSTREGPDFLCRRYVRLSEFTCYGPARIVGNSVGFVPVSTCVQRNMWSTYVYIFAVVQYK
jgi:hypothetical protein